jgi:hypothetical protein
MIKTIFALRLVVAIPGVALAQSQAARDSAEASVLRWLAGRYTDSTAIIRSTSSNGTICDHGEPLAPNTLAAELRRRGHNARGCTADAKATTGDGRFGVAPGLRAAIVNHDSLNPISTAFPTRVLALTGRRIIDSTAQVDDGTCRGVLRLQATRVGLDSTLTYAALSYHFSQGHGPYPGCGGADGATVYLRRRAGDDWEVIETVAMWMT